MSYFSNFLTLLTISAFLSYKETSTFVENNLAITEFDAIIWRAKALFNTNYKK